MTINGYQIAFFTITFLVPGYVIGRIWDTLINRAPQRVHGTQPVHQIEFLRWLAVSALSVAPWIVVVFLIDGGRFASPDTMWAYALEHRWWVSLSWLGIVFVWPVILGVAVAQVYGRGLWLHFLDVTHLRLSRPETPPDSAWDNRFKRATEGAYVLVVLNDNSWIAGVFGVGSHASSDKHERDVFISEVHLTSLDENNAGLPTFDYTGGILIPAWKIKVIRFWNPQGPTSTVTSDLEFTNES